jgi:16S rRNA processing protein RimM
VGYVARAHGLKGEVAVRTHDSESEVLGEVRRVWLHAPAGSGVHQIVSARRAAREWLLRLSDVDSRETAEALRRATVAVFREDLSAPEEATGEFFQGDLVGLEAVNEEGLSLGKIEAVWNTGPVPNLVVRTAQGGELLVPFADEFVRVVDPEHGRIVLRPPEYLE